MISLDQARSEILARISPLGDETVPIEDAIGRTLASGVSSREALPPFDNTAMDGFVVRHADLAEASETHPVPLPTVEVIEAGRPASRPLAAGEAMRIFTGAPIPEGGDAIVPFERCLAYDDGSVTFGAPVKEGAHIRRAAEDFSSSRSSLRSRRGRSVTPTSTPSALDCVAGAQKRSPGRS